MIEGAQAGISGVSGRAALAIGLKLEQALMRWRSDDRRGAIRLAAEALEWVSLLPDDESFQALRSHKLARGIVGLFFSELPGMPAPTGAPLTFGTSTVLESETKAPEKETLTAIADHMRILAVVGASLASNSGSNIARRRCCPDRWCRTSTSLRRAFSQARRRNHPGQKGP